MLRIIIIDGLSFALPLFIMSVGGIFSEGSGITNLALEGFQGVGAFLGAVTVALLTNFTGTNPQLIYYGGFILAAFGGGIYSLLHALLCVKFKADQVISGVVMNILAMAMTSFLTKNFNLKVFGSATNKIPLGASTRITIPYLSDIPYVGAIFEELYPFEILIVIIALIMWFVLYKTVFGMRLRACGDNPHSVDAAGVNVHSIRTSAIFISGCLSGIAGMSFAYSISANFSPDIYLGYGYLSIAAMIFGNWQISRAFVACLIFGLAKSVGSVIISKLGLPSSYNDLVRIFPYVLTLLLLIFFSKHNRSPRSLGQIYDKGRR
ncbi:MAG: ABC transporter permease [Synergistaceae bacterium]|nr:ABC transporter permease [Synergistaceae bacterium]MBR0094455.1 ABC transporter permease [Synergistaceae bacterium]